MTSKDYNELCKFRNDLEDILQARKILLGLRVVKDWRPYFHMSVDNLAEIVQDRTREMIQLAKNDKGLREAIGSNLLV